MDAKTVIGGIVGGYLLGSMIDAEERAARTAHQMGRRLAHARLGQNGNGNGAVPLTPAGAGPVPSSGFGQFNAFDPFSLRYSYPWWWNTQYYAVPQACPPGYPYGPTWGYPGHARPAYGVSY